MEYILRELEESYRNKIEVIAFIDDIFIMGESEVDVKMAYEELNNRMISELNCSINKDKSNIFNRSIDEGMVVLGIPIGIYVYEESYFRKFMDNILAEMKTISERVYKHLFHTLLRLVYSGKLVYMLRNVTINEETLKKYDLLLNNLLREYFFIEYKIEDFPEWELIRYPFLFNGILPNLKDLNRVGNISMIIQVMDEEDNLDELIRNRMDRELLNKERFFDNIILNNEGGLKIIRKVDGWGVEIEGIGICKDNTQREIMSGLKHKELHRLGSEKKDKAMKIVIKAIEDKTSHVLFHYFPVNGVFLEDERFCHALSIFFGVKGLTDLQDIFGLGDKCPLCGDNIEEHDRKCIKAISGARDIRHNNIIKGVVDYICEVKPGKIFKVEYKNRLKEIKGDGGNVRPDILLEYVEGLSRTTYMGENMSPNATMLDVAIVDHFNKQGDVVDNVITKRENEKIGKYKRSKLYKEKNLSIEPLVMSTNFRMGERFMVFMGAIRNRCQNRVDNNYFIARLQNIIANYNFDMKNIYRGKIAEFLAERERRQVNLGGYMYGGQ